MNKIDVVIITLRNELLESAMTLTFTFAACAIFAWVFMTSQLLFVAFLLMFVVPALFKVRKHLKMFEERKKQEESVAKQES